MQLRLHWFSTETLAVSFAAEIIEVPVIQTQEKTQQVVNTHVQHVVDTVEVEKSKIIEETLQKMKPIIQEKISQVSKHIEVLQLQLLNKVVDMPVVGQRQASMVEKIQTTMVVPQAQIVEKTVEIPVLQIVKKTVMIPEIRTVQDPQTSESLSIESTVTEMTDHETIVQNVMPNIGLDSFIDDFSSVDRKGLNHQDCEVPSHVGKQSGSMHQQHTPGQAEIEEKREEGEKGEVRKGGRERESGAAQEGRDGLDSGDKKQEAEEENDSDLRQSGRVQDDAPDGGKSMT